MTTGVAGSMPDNRLDPGARRDVLGCALLVALACAVRFTHLGSQSLWGDELFTAHWSQLDPGFLLGEGAHVETNPPTSYLIMHAWMRLFGASELSVRFPPALYSVATVALVYVLAGMLFDRGTALLAGLLAAIEPTSVHYAREARPFAMLACMQGLALVSLAGYGRDAPARGIRKWRWATLFVLSAVGAIAAHYTAVAFVAACFAVVGVFLFTDHPFPTREALIWCGVVVTVGVFSLPLLGLASGMVTSPGIAWIPPVTLDSLRRFFLGLLSPSLSPNRTLMQLVGASLLVLLLSALFRLRLTRDQFGLLVLLPVTFLLIVVAVSLKHPILLTRIGIWLIIPICILLARAATVQAAPWHRLGYTAALLLIFLGLLAEYYRNYQKENWREAARVVAFNPACGGPIVAVGIPVGITYYQPLVTSRARIWLKRPDDGVGYALAAKALQPEIVEVGALAEFLRNHPRAALVLRARDRGLLDPLDAPRIHLEVGGGLTVSCF
jgi:4-amino-4-deoxy-L-arabinose transferase-like glycosyltransferase